MCSACLGARLPLTGCTGWEGRCTKRLCETGGACSQRGSRTFSAARNSGHCGSVFNVPVGYAAANSPD